MDFTSHDIAVIEQALQLAINAETKDSKVNHFREVLNKLQKNAAVAMHGSYLQTASQDGVRYDYDDSSDLL
ncbi:hypothetical protein [Paenibacillus radicis (ex Xue et al. 2023)]|uniref:Uncharacterized protein n=1 Tax=Paenibacillus radicis (ex Xue et al. 2023) TaxID=2972489 RepID=A0ABT1YHK0_9BACL|nr:hypothetical protein [Paenibacillus radicis (ex Xue et al. 2023)]MCR8631889.1 hypothetical protein [Paenibacillus radicis (ex Xue et al. 2023)]